MLPCLSYLWKCQLGSLVVQLVGWPGIFFLNLPVGLAAVLIGLAMLKVFIAMIVFLTIHSSM